ncbi:MAG: ribonuclease H-like domain-containing protein [bacterium]|nr:ribonuclease H-like domain-containing protein [bacterium]
MRIRKGQIDSLVLEILERTQGERFLEITEVEQGKGFHLIKFIVDIPFSSANYEVDFRSLENHGKTIQKFKMLEELHRSSYKNLAIFDIETGGLSPDGQIFLAGFLIPEKEKAIAVQFIARTLKKEKTLLKWVIEHFEKYKILTFNGTTFDLPFVKRRCELHNLEYIEPKFHLDILLLARYIWKDSYGSKKLSVLENNLMEIYREFDVPSGLLPSLIKLYKNRRDEKYLKIISRHNLYDLITTFKLLFKIRKSLFLNS